MPKEYRGDLTGSGRRFALVVSQYNASITGKLRDGAVKTLAEHGVADEDDRDCLRPRRLGDPRRRRPLRPLAKRSMPSSVWAPSFAAKRLTINTLTGR